MFTGIARGLGTITEISPKKEIITITVSHGDILLNPLVHGNSVMVNGVCLSVVAFDTNTMSFDVIPETLKLTDFGDLDVGDKVNLEQPVAMGEELGGHVLQGHIETVGVITEVVDESGDFRLRIKVRNEEVSPSIILKGYIGVDGVSLTTTTWDRETGVFEVALIPDTLTKTTLGIKGVGAKVNIETDIANRVIGNAVSAYFAEFDARLKRLENSATKE